MVAVALRNPLHDVQAEHHVRGVGAIGYPIGGLGSGATAGRAAQGVAQRQRPLACERGRSSVLPSVPAARITTGPLARLVRSHDERALDLYLLLRAVAVAEPWKSTKDARVWARVMGLVNAQGDHDISAISKAWRRLGNSNSSGGSGRGASRASRSFARTAAVLPVVRRRGPLNAGARLRPPRKARGARILGRL
ncbi:MAG: hypothetical protein ACRDYA_00345 [Egibacteraceae bacterium]